MSEQLLTLLRFSLLALLYLFLFRVVRAVWAELAPAAETPSRRRRRSGVPDAAPGPVAVGANRSAAGAVSTRQPTPAPGGPKRKRHKPPHLVVLSPAETAGTEFVLVDEMTVGRGSGCGITIDDTFVSQVHARVYRDGDTFYIEDLGSTNGTTRNGRPVGGPQALTRGDHLGVGNTTLELR